MHCSNVEYQIYREDLNGYLFRVYRTSIVVTVVIYLEYLRVLPLLYVRAQRYTSQTELSGLNAGAGAGRPSHVGGGATMGKGPVVAAPPQPPQLPQMVGEIDFSMLT